MDEEHLTDDAASDDTRASDTGARTGCAGAASSGCCWRPRGEHLGLSPPPAPRDGNARDGVDEDADGVPHSGKERVLARPDERLELEPAVLER